jgi:phage tail protein X
MRRVRSKAGDSVNRLLYRETGRADDTAEEALWSANPGLAEYGPVLPSGVEILLPDFPAERKARSAVTMWD